MRSKSNIFLIGPMGAGKTTIGNILARDLRKQFIDSDQEIEKRTGVDIRWIFDVEGEEGFRQREKLVIDELTQLSDIVLATGGGSIIESDNRKNLSARGTVIYLTISLDQQFQRIEFDQKRPIDPNNKEEYLKNLWQIREPLYLEIADHVFATDGRSPKVVATEIVDFLLNQKC